MGADTKRMAEGLPEKQDGTMAELVEVTEAMAHGNFYKEISTELQGELGRLAEFINLIKGGMINVHVNAKYTSEKMPQATVELNDINEVTRVASVRVLELVENVLERQKNISEGLAELKSGGAGSREVVEELEKYITGNHDDLVGIIATMSFQDMTGQRIKKIIQVIDEVQTRLLEIMLSIGARIEEQEGRIADRKKEMLQKLIQTKQDTELNQGVVDDILNDLGLA